ncbi:MAG: glutathione S-transferase N-terminal domain-containing protein [Alphaproteobacteria bacterium]|nr:glutathione S-transferase N-terminal domain-containing protein [Alphaproteobacteria bacterium]
MKLRYWPTSPFVRKVMVVAIETGLLPKMTPEPTNVWSADTDIGRDNPLGKVPALMTDDGQVLFDSPVICEYLDSLHGGAKLFPPAGPARWQALRQQAIADGILDAAILARLEANRPQERVSQDWIIRQKRAVARAMDTLEAEAGALGVAITIGHIAVGCACGYLDLRFAADRWRQTRPKLAAWYETMASRRSFLDTVPKDPA